MPFFLIFPLRSRTGQDRITGYQKKGWLQKPLGIMLEEGEFGKRVAIDNAGIENSLRADWETIGGNGAALQPSSSTEISLDYTKGVPTYGEDPTTSTEEFI